MAENKSNDISIPEHLEKYRKIIEDTVDITLLGSEPIEHVELVDE